jgi:hypothetical protein
MTNKLLRSVIVFISFILFSFSAAAQTTITVGSSGATYSTLKAAFDAVNAGTVTGTITIQVVAGTTETASAVLNASGTGSASYVSINIYPTVTGLTITGALAAPLIDLNGADNVTVDGRLNASGATKDLTVTNTSTSNTVGTSTIRFINDATGNTVKYCTIRGSEGLNSYGVIYFGVSAGANGNDNNTISNNNITNAGTRPVNAVYSLGTAGKENSSVTFDSNNFYDFFHLSLGGSAMNIVSGNSEWTITGNSFYNVSSWNPSNTGYNIIVINSTGGNNFNVSGNYLGGNAPLCAGTPFTKGGGGRDGINCIYLLVGTSVASNIQGNTIRNFNYTNVNNTRNFAGIVVDAGNVNIGTTSGNIIGASTGTGSITGYNIPSFWGILTGSPGIINIENNTIGSVSISTGATEGVTIQGISVNGSGTVNIRNNNIGSLSTANSINAPSTSTAAGQQVYGIVNGSSGVVTISGNTIANLANNTSNASGAISGIYFGSGASGSSVTGNFVRSFALTNASPGGNTLYGINIAGGTGTYSNNIISIGNNAAATIYGINDASGTNSLFFNTVYIGGTPTTGANLSYAIRSTAANSRNYRNNLFVNARSNSGATGKHYAIGLTSTPATIDYNAYYTSGTDGILGIYNSVDKATLADWKLSSVQDCNSYNSNPSFAVPGGTLVADYLPGNVDLMSVTGTGVTTDYSGTARNNSVPAMGALEYGITPGSNSLHISSFMPVTGAVGSSVAITGTNFTGASALSFNGTPVVAYTVNSATSITATVPAGATTGPIAVSIACGPFTDVNNFTVQSLLPVSWLNFTAHATQGNVLLAWSTSAEQQSKDFIVEFSDNGNTWHSLGTITAAGNSNTTSDYQFTHLKPNNGKNYYRIVQRDIDGKTSYSKIISINFNGYSNSIFVYGNPVNNGQLVIRVSKATYVNILNQNGQLLFSKFIGPGVQTIPLTGFAKGVYILKTAQATQKFIIN